MNIALLLIIVIAVVLAIVGGLNTALNWLLWVALIVGVIALIAFLFRVISGSRVPRGRDAASVRCREVRG